MSTCYFVIETLEEIGTYVSKIQIKLKVSGKPERQFAPNFLIISIIMLKYSKKYKPNVTTSINKYKFRLQFV